MRRIARVCQTVVLAGVLISPAAPAAVCEAKSGPTTVALLELYTSEGCDSCPPAERWLAELRQSKLIPDRLVPLALHVDYWNNLGWIDPFSQSEFSQRQRELARRAGAVTVYTPEFLLNGNEYRRWPWKDFSSDIDRINATPARADIALRLERSPQRVRITGTASVKPGSANAGLFLALTENNLASDVRAGENRGRRLAHEFVVRRLVGPLPIPNTGLARFDEGLALSAGWKPADLGVVAFVQNLQGTEILQALARPLCR